MFFISAVVNKSTDVKKSLFGGGSNDFCFLADCVTVCVESEVYWDPPVAFPLMSGVFGLDSSFSPEKQHPILVHVPTLRDRKSWIAHLVKFVT